MAVIAPEGEAGSVIAIGLGEIVRRSMEQPRHAWHHHAAHVRRAIQFFALGEIAVDRIPHLRVDNRDSAVAAPDDNAEIGEVVLLVSAEPPKPHRTTRPEEPLPGKREVREAARLSSIQHAGWHLLYATRLDSDKLRMPRIVRRATLPPPRRLRVGPPARASARLATAWPRIVGQAKAA